MKARTDDMLLLEVFPHGLVEGKNMVVVKSIEDLASTLAVAHEAGIS